MRPVSKGNTPIDDNAEAIEFKDYSRSRRYLIDRIGEYCSYCESNIQTSLAIEHVLPKSLHNNLELKWSNLLLACTNCNSTKGADNIILEDYIWPDLGNSFELYKYCSDGLVQPANSLSSELIVKAEAMINLVGLNKEAPNKGTVKWEEASDRRVEHRIQALYESKKFSDSYDNQENKVDYRELLVSKVNSNGFWSIWMHAFSDYPEVQKALIESFSGTNITYFQDILNP